MYKTNNNEHINIVEEDRESYVPASKSACKMQTIENITPQEVNFQDAKHNIFKAIITENNPNLYDSDKLDTGQTIFSDDRIFISSWNNIENISSRLVDVKETTVVLECLVDKENKIYEEREFDKDLFDGYEIKEGYFFLLRFYTRKNEMKLEVHDNKSGLVKSDFFESVNLYKTYKDNPLFKK